MPVKEAPFDVGDEVVIYANFVGSNGAPANPTTVTLQIGRRDGTILHAYTLAQMSIPQVGTLEKNYIIEERDLVYSWDATGAVQVVREGTIPTRKRTLPKP